ncbi:DUF397 domain-containing protein [Micromonospora sp. KC606]|nr:DUF397 domain-containing protein [Micromonospora sp. KC606]
MEMTGGARWRKSSRSNSNDGACVSPPWPTADGPTARPAGRVLPSALRRRGHGFRYTADLGRRARGSGVKRTDVSVHRLERLLKG